MTLRDEIRTRILAALPEIRRRAGNGLALRFPEAEASALAEARADLARAADQLGRALTLIGNLSPDAAERTRAAELHRLLRKD